MRWLYLTDSRIPANRASSIHVDQLMHALTDIIDDVVLLCQKGEKDHHKDFRMERVSIPHLKGGLLWLMWEFKKSIKQIAPSFIYSRFLLLPLINKSIPYVLELHDDSWNKGFLFQLAFKKALKAKNCKGLVTITKAIHCDLEKAFPGLTKSVRVIEDAALPAKPEYLASYNNKVCLTLGYVGSLHKGKGMELIIPLAEKMPDHLFKIIGGTNEEIRILKENLKSNNIKFCGFIKHDEVWRYMLDIDICLLPNQDEVLTGKKSNIGKYTSPLKMFEYMSYSKPIIASNLSVLKEVLDDQVAFFASPTNTNDWVDAINKLSDVDQRRELGTNAYLRFIENYTWEKRAERILAFVNEQLEKQ